VESTKIKILLIFCLTFSHYYASKPFTVILRLAAGDVRDRPAASSEAVFQSVRRPGQRFYVNEYK